MREFSGVEHRQGTQMGPSLLTKLLCDLLRRLDYVTGFFSRLEYRAPPLREGNKSFDIKRGVSYFFPTEFEYNSSRTMCTWNCELFRIFSGVQLRMPFLVLLQYSSSCSSRNEGRKTSNSWAGLGGQDPSLGELLFDFCLWCRNLHSVNVVPMGANNKIDGKTLSFRLRNTTTKPL